MRTCAGRMAVAGLMLVTACSEGPASTTVPDTVTVAVTEETSPSTSVPRAVVVPAVGQPPSGVDLDSLCMQGAVFGDPADSPYVLPYPVGNRYRLNQSYCFAQGGHQNQLAYDFLMPIGAEVLASRKGEVIGLREDIRDGELSSGNFVHIRHEDGSISTYAHLQHQGVDVEVGQWVVAGEHIATAGMSGLASDPHLHFAVVDAARRDVAVNFRNADGPLDMLGGLLRDGVFVALPPDQPVEHRSSPGFGEYRNADLRGAELAGAVLWGFGFAEADLSGADLSGANLGWVSASGVRMVGADLSYANLGSADLRGAVLTGALMMGADLSVADLRDADLGGVDLSGAYLAAADLRGADLGGANLTGALLIGVAYDDMTIWPEGFVPPPMP